MTSPQADRPEPVNFTAAPPGAPASRRRGSPRRRRRTAPAGAPLPSGARGRAILDGRRAAWARQYDEWSFTAGLRVPYLERVRYERLHAIHEDRSQFWAGLRETLRSLRL